MEFHLQRRHTAIPVCPPLSLCQATNSRPNSCRLTRPPAQPQGPPERLAQGSTPLLHLPLTMKTPALRPCSKGFRLANTCACC